MSSPITKNVSAQTKTPSPQKKVVAKKEAATDKPAAKPRKPTLKEKHSRFLVSNYSLIQYLSAKGLMTEEAVETAYSEIKMFAPLEDQEAFYDAYISESKTTKKTMKKFITQRNKPPKAPRAKKEPKAKKEDGAPKEKKPRAKKTTKVENDTEVDVVSQIANNNDGAENLINELTAAANQSPSAVTAQTTPPAAAAAAAADAKVEEAPGAPEKKTRKPRAKKEGEAVKEKKPRAKKNAKKEEEPQVVENVQEEEEEIHTQEITIGSTLYLIDNDNNLYSTETHEQVGTYNADANEVVASAA
jgi:hypothetical protein